MKSLTMFIAVMTLMLVVMPASAQQAEHHPQGQMMKSDTTTGTMQSGMTQGGMMSGAMMRGGMMQGGMMGGQGMMGNCPMCGRMMRGGMMGQGMMSGGMMGGMHGGMGMMGGIAFLNQYNMLINKLPQMQTELSLTDSQLEELEQVKTDFQKQQIDLRASIQKQLIDLQTAMDKNPTAADLRAGMNDVTDTRVNMTVQAFETAQKMKDILNTEQKEKLQSSNFGGMMGGMRGQMNY